MTISEALNEPSGKLSESESSTGSEGVRDPFQELNRSDTSTGSEQIRDQFQELSATGVRDSFRTRGRERSQ